MGGKNKKHKAPGAAAVRAAVSASRAKAAEAGAAPEAQTKKPAARPPAAAGPREPRVKPGPKIYSFNSANDSGGPANLDKSILKVVINNNLEQRVIGVINEHKKQNDDKGVISGRLTAKKLQDLYTALQALSFKTSDIEDAMSSTLLQGGDLHSALDWLCLNLSDDSLPEGFSQEFEEQQPRSRPRFQPPPGPAAVPPPVQHPTAGTPREGPESKPKKEEKNSEVNMKEWILRYAEQQNEEEKSENSASVEEEEKFDPDSLCGYQIRMESRASEATRLLYCTTGVLLRKLQEDGLLSSVSHVIVDEVHERSVQSDFLLVILKEILQKRSDLHLVLMSATVDSDKFSTYFTHCPVLRISGRSYPVEVFHLEDIIEETGFVLEKDSEYCQKYLEEEEEITIHVTGKAGATQKYQEYLPARTGAGAGLDSRYQQYSGRTQHALLHMNPQKVNLDLVAELLAFLDRSPRFRSTEGAVLVFLPGLAHIQQLYDLLLTDRRFSSERYKVIALHSILSTQDQAAAFTLPPPGVRKVVLATNIAETGITIPDVVFVVDTGRTKENKYHESSQMSSLVETFVSKASALQRQGRAGRVRDGVCFRMYTRERFEGFLDYSVPEILRVPLEELCLHIMKCSLGPPEDFLSKALDPPQPQVISSAMHLLRRIGACEPSEPRLTPLGQHLAALPVNVKIGKMLIFGAVFGCLDPVATLAAVMTEKSPFTTPIGRKEEADLAKAALAVADSDHLTIYRAYLGWKSARQEGGYRSEVAYCRRHFLSRTALLTLEDVKQELMKLVRAAGFSPPAPAGSWDGRRAGQALSFQEIALLKAVLAAGLYDNVGRIICAKSVDVTERLACVVETAQGKAQVHPSSVNRALQTHGWLLYQEKVRYARVYLRETTLISPFPVLLFGGDIEVQHRERLLSVDGWIYFQAPVKIAVIFKQLRVLIDSVLRKKLENPKMSLENDKILQIITELIKTENSN
ncbi:ATP-dependent RNA helicase DHX29 isoform X2 [Phyllostomus hastatus]|uniref:ATP-dependent RNA helicase DHX29 isoform X2 n=1 Tax=Phyllostomus hastatus TaxID=9423 RepID=UPI001E6810E1|nr:ATP-dependent RNA helicase DHX29 isoform X2 [Phyllostomus hastatus]